MPGSPRAPSRYRCRVIDELIAAAGPVPARSDAARWRQVALLATAAALGGGARARADLAAVLQALDHPDAAADAAGPAPDQPWELWWGLLAEGQRGAGGLDARAEEASRIPFRGPDAREVRRRVADLRAELAALAGHPDADARFSLQGMADGPPRRVLLVGRSSATYVVEPSWTAMRLVRLGPSDGPSAGNRAHLPLTEIIAAVRRGERGAAREVPPDDAPPFDPAGLLEGIKEGRGVRDRRLLDLADEVRSERERLVAERARLEDDRAALRSALAQVQAMRAEGAAGAPLPTSRAEAAELLDVPSTAPTEQVERAYRRQVVMCHPDRVADLHPSIRARAEGLTIALNAARDLLLGVSSPSRRRGSAAG